MPDNDVDWERTMTDQVELVVDWTAYHDRMPGKPPILRVDGTCQFRTDGCTATLKPRAGNTGINQFMLALDLVVTFPDSGAAEVITDVPVHWELQTDLRDDEVAIDLVGADSPGKTIRVETVQ